MNLKLKCLMLCLLMLSVRTESPVIGILTIHASDRLKLIEQTTYLYKSYVRFIEESGFRWIPISVFEDNNIIIKKLSKINGVLLTGGAEKMGEKEKPSLYARVVKQIIEFAKESNKNGINFPILAICMGFEAMLITLTDYKINLKRIINRKISKRIHLKKKAYRSYLSLDFNKQNLDNFNKEKLFYFHHKYGFLMDDINRLGLHKTHINVLASYNTKTERVLAMYEHKKFPFLAVQFHPEKVQFEAHQNPNINKSELAKELNTKFSFVFRKMVGKTKTSLSDFDIDFYKLNTETMDWYGWGGEAFIYLFDEGKEYCLVDSCYNNDSYIFDFILNNNA